MRWKRYAYWLSGISFFLAMAIVGVMDWGGPIPTGPLSWGNIAALLGSGIPAIFIGLDWMLSPKDLLDWLAKHVPWWSPPAWSLRFFGCFVSLSGMLGTTMGILAAFEALGISIFYQGVGIWRSQ